MFIHSKSHTDHLSSVFHLAWIQVKFGDRSGFFVETIEMPKHLDRLPCGLWGPIMGDEPVLSGTWMGRRDGREYDSRLCDRPFRETHLITVIGGTFIDDETGKTSVDEKGQQDCILYTAFGGPLAPREPGDPTLPEPERDASEKFWSVHALSNRRPSEWAGGLTT